MMIKKPIRSQKSYFCNKCQSNHYYDSEIGKEHMHLLLNKQKIETKKEESEEEELEEEKDQYCIRCGNTFSTNLYGMRCPVCGYKTSNLY